LRDDESESISLIPLIARIIIVGIEPLTIVITVHIQQVQIAVRIARNIVPTTAL